MQALAAAVSYKRMAALALLSLALACQASDFTVTSTGNSGPGTLRQAILGVNSNAGPHTITFDIPGPGPFIITPTASLPTITREVTIDGTTQPGFAGTPIIELNGSSAGGSASGIAITRGHCTVKGLVINRFRQNGILLSNGGTNTIVGNYLGTDVTGALRRGNLKANLLISSSAGNVIGGRTAAERNVISGSEEDGVDILGAASRNNIIQGNYIGTDAGGTLSVSNWNGIWITQGANNNLIGGTNAGAGNLISGNNEEGIEIQDATARWNVIQGNLIGTDRTGTLSVSNRGVGVLFESSGGNQLGGSSPGARNVISGNAKDGVRVAGSTATNNLIQGNLIGLDITGSTNLGNQIHGICITNATEAASGSPAGNTIGGLGAGEGNILAFNLRAGIAISSGTNSVLGNSIYSNAGLGIDLGNIGVQANDLTDTDTGANNLQNYPVLGGATNQGGILAISGSLRSRTNLSYRLEFFTSPLAHSSTYGEGKHFIGATNISLSGTSSANFTANFPSIPAGDTVVTATATDPFGNTSEFSAARAWTVLLPPVINGQPEDQLLDLGQQIQLSVSASGAGPLTYQWWFDGTPLPNATNATLVRAATQASQSGSYWVVVANAAGSTTSRLASVVVVTEPLILQHPFDLWAVPGDPLVLSVNAMGPDRQYWWTRNGVPIPGATQSSLVFSNSSPQDGGLYRVIVYNDFGMIESSEALVHVASPALPFADSFTNRGSINSPSGQGSGQNVGATIEMDEPRHDNAPGGRSVWLTWVAPTNGIAVFDTLGSDFDTVLAIYTGTELETLTRVTSDDDLATYANSRVQFNAEAGMTYLIAVDSRDSLGSGNIVLTWSLLVAATPLPSNVVTPPGASVMPGQPAVVNITFDAPNEGEPLRFQWYHDGAPVPGATAASLFLSSVTVESVGAYALHMEAGEWALAVRSVEVQINTEGETRASARKKLDEALLTPLLGASYSSSASAAPRRLTKAGSLPIASGYSGSQIFRTYPGKDPTEPTVCGVLGGASYWFVYVPSEDGVLALTTDGSSFDTLLGVFIDDGRSLGYGSLSAKACDNNSGTNGRTSALTLPVTSGTKYYIMVDGVNGASGTVFLNYRMNTAPAISAIADQSIQMNEATAVVPFTISDRETIAGQLIVLGGATATNLIGPTGFVFEGSGTNRTVRFVPNPNCFGTNVVWISVTDPAGSTRKTQLTLRVAIPAAVSLELPHGIVGVPYSAPLTMNGGAPPYHYELSAPVEGWTLSATGSLSGVPTMPGTNTFQVTITDATGHVVNRLVQCHVVPPLRVLTQRLDAQLSFQLTGRPGRLYILESASAIDALTWSPLATNSAPNGQIEFPPLTPSGPTTFFRIREE